MDSTHHDHLFDHLTTHPGGADIAAVGELDGVGDGVVARRSSHNNNNRNSNNSNKNHNNSHKIGQTSPTPVPSHEPHPDPSFLDTHQRAHIRGSLLAMITSLTLRFASEKEIRPLLQFMAICRDPIVLMELGHVLLVVMVEGGIKVIITSSYGYVFSCS